MHTFPQKSSVDLVREATGQDLGGLTRDAFISRVEALLKEQEDLEERPVADGKGVVAVTLKNIGMASAVLSAVLDFEKTMRLN